MALVYHFNAKSYFFFWNCSFPLFFISSLFWKGVKKQQYLISTWYSRTPTNNHNETDVNYSTAKKRTQACDLKDSLINSRRPARISARRWLSFYCTTPPEDNAHLLAETFISDPSRRCRRAGHWTKSQSSLISIWIHISGQKQSLNWSCNLYSYCIAIILQVQMNNWFEYKHLNGKLLLL